ncbi:MAG: autoinducer binding domain-containing protein [Pseudorhodobacter sp.]|nr:autoinducer binding domain-containing protein [Pseudorhodobacter sp.]
MSEVFKLLSAIAQAASVDAVWGLCTPFYARMGFSRVNYTYTQFLTENSFGHPDDALFLTTNSPEYIRYFTRDQFYAKTPLFHWVLKNHGACTWRWVHDALEAGTLTPVEAETVRINLANGVSAGITISFSTDSPRARAGLGLIADRGLTHDDVDQTWQRHGEQIMAVANMMHLKITRLPLTTRRRHLTKRQREAQEWVADGKTTQDIAVLMRVSVAMVEKHLRLAREALDVSTTAQAVAKGALLNKIFHHVSQDQQAGIK